jgi:hypothetical protein
MSFPSETDGTGVRKIEQPTAPRGCTDLCALPATNNGDGDEPYHHRRGVGGELLERLAAAGVPIMAECGRVRVPRRPLPPEAASRRCVLCDAIAAGEFGAAS